MNKFSVADLPQAVSQTNYVELITVASELDVAILGSSPTVANVANNLAFKKKYRKLPPAAATTPQFMANVAPGISSQAASSYSASSAPVEIVTFGGLNDILRNEDLDALADTYVCDNSKANSLTKLPGSFDPRENEISFRLKRYSETNQAYLRKLNPWLNIDGSNASDGFDIPVYGVYYYYDQYGFYFGPSGGYICRDVNSLIPGQTYRITVKIAVPINSPTAATISFGAEGIIVKSNIVGSQDYIGYFRAEQSTSSDACPPNSVVFWYNVDFDAPNTAQVRIFLQSYDSIRLLDISACVVPPAPPPIPKPTSCADLLGNSSYITVINNPLFDKGLSFWVDKNGKEISVVNGYNLSLVYDADNQVAILYVDSSGFIKSIYQLITGISVQFTYQIAVGLDSTEDNVNHGEDDWVEISATDAYGRKLGSAKAYYYPSIDFQGNQVSRKEASFVVSNVVGSTLKIELKPGNGIDNGSFVPMRVAYALVCTNAVPTNSNSNPSDTSGAAAVVCKTGNANIDARTTGLSYDPIKSSTGTYDQYWTYTSPNSITLDQYAYYIGLYNGDELSRTYTNLTPGGDFILNVNVLDGGDVTATFNLDGSLKTLSSNQTKFYIDRYTQPYGLLNTPNANSAIKPLQFKVTIPKSGVVKVKITALANLRGCTLLAKLDNLNPYPNKIVNGLFNNDINNWTRVEGPFDLGLVNQRPFYMTKTKVRDLDYKTEIDAVKLWSSDKLSQQVTGLQPGRFYYLKFSVTYKPLVFTRKDRGWGNTVIFPVTPDIFAGYAVHSDPYSNQGDYLQYGIHYYGDGTLVPTTATVMRAYAKDSGNLYYNLYAAESVDPLSLFKNQSNVPLTSFNVNVRTGPTISTASTINDCYVIIGPVKGDGIANIEFQADANVYFEPISLSNVALVPVEVDLSETYGLPYRISNISACMYVPPTSDGSTGTTPSTTPNSDLLCGKDSQLTYYNDFKKNAINWSPTNITRNDGSLTIRRWASMAAPAVPNYDVSISFDLLTNTGVTLVANPGSNDQQWVSTDNKAGRKIVNIGLSAAFWRNYLSNYNNYLASTINLLAGPIYYPSLIDTPTNDTEIVEFITLYVGSVKIGLISNKYVMTAVQNASTTFGSRDNGLWLSQGIVTFGDKIQIYRTVSKYFDPNGSEVKSGNLFNKLSIVNGGFINNNDDYEFMNSLGDFFLVKEYYFYAKNVDVRNNYNLTIGFAYRGGYTNNYTDRVMTPKKIVQGTNESVDPYVFDYLLIDMLDSSFNSLNADITGALKTSGYVGELWNVLSLPSDTHKSTSQSAIASYQGMAYDYGDYTNAHPNGLASIIIAADNPNRNDIKAASGGNVPAAPICYDQLKVTARWFNDLDNLDPENVKSSFNCSQADPPKSTPFQLGNFRTLGTTNAYKVKDDGKVIIKLRYVVGRNNVASYLNDVNPNTSTLGLGAGARVFADYGNIARFIDRIPLPYLTVLDPSTISGSTTLTNFQICAVAPADPLVNYPSLVTADASLRWKGVPRQQVNIFNIFMRYKVRDVIDYNISTIAYGYPAVERHVGVVKEKTCDFWGGAAGVYSPRMSENLSFNDNVPSPNYMIASKVVEGSISDISTRSSYLYSIPTYSSVASGQDKLVIPMSIPPSGILEQVDIFFLMNKITSQHQVTKLKPASVVFINNYDGTACDTTNAVAKLSDESDLTYVTVSSTNPGPKFVAPLSYLIVKFSQPTSSICAQRYSIDIRARKGLSNTAAGLTIPPYPYEILQPTVTARESGISIDSVRAPVINPTFDTFKYSSLDDHTFKHSVQISQWDSSTVEIKIYLDMGWNYSKVERPVNIGDFLGMTASVDISDITLTVYEDSETNIAPSSVCAPDPASEFDILLHYKRSNGKEREFIKTVPLSGVLSQNGQTCGWDIPSLVAKGESARWGVASFVLDDLYGKGLDQITKAVIGTYTGIGNLNLLGMKSRGIGSFKYPCDAEIIMTEVVKGQLNDAVQSIALPNPTSGTWTITVNISGDNPQTTSPIPFDATAASVKSAIELLSSVGAYNTLVTGIGTSADPYVIEFVGELAGRPIPLLVVDGSLLKGASTGVAEKIVTGTKNERQTITPAPQTLEAVVLEFGEIDPKKSIPITYNASLDERQAAIEAMSSIGVGNVSVTGRTTDRTVAYTGPMIIDFIGALANTNVPSFKCYQQDGVTASTKYSVSVNWHGGVGANEVQLLKIGATGGTFALIITTPGINGITVKSADIPYNVAAQQLKNVLVDTLTISPQPGADLLWPSDVDVTSIDNSEGISAYRIEFMGRYASTPWPLLVVDSAKLTGSTIETKEVLVGSSVSDQQGLTIKKANSGYYYLNILFPAIGYFPAIKAQTSRIRYNAPAADLQRAINNSLNIPFPNLPAPVVVLDRMAGVTDTNITSRFVIKFRSLYGDVPMIEPVYRLTLKCDPVLLPYAPPPPYGYMPTPADEVDDLSCQSGPLFTRPAAGDEETIINPCAIRDSANVAKVYKYERDLISPNQTTSSGKMLTIRDAVLIKGINPNAYTPYLRDRANANKLTEISYSRNLEIGMSIVVVQKDITTSGNLARIRNHLSSTKEILPSRFSLAPPVK